MNWSSEWQSSTPKQLEADLAWHTIKEVKLSIIVKDGDFPTTVEAVQVGDLAVHKNLCEDKDWQVTHVPTLTRFNVVVGLHKKSDLIEWCKKVQGMLQDDWKELAKLDKTTYKERSEAKDRIMRLCQNTAIGVIND